MWLISRIGPLLAGIKQLVVASKAMSPAEAREIQSVLAFLDAESIASSRSISDEFCFTFSGKAPITMSSLLDFPVRMCQLADKLDTARGEYSTVRTKVLLLYLTQYLTRDAESVLEPPEFWAHTVLGTPDGPARIFALKRVRFARIFTIPKWVLAMLSAICPRPIWIGCGITHRISQMATPDGG